MPRVLEQKLLCHFGAWVTVLPLEEHVLQRVVSNIEQSVIASNAHIMMHTILTVVV